MDEPPLNAKEGGVIRRGYDAELDELHAIATRRQGVDRPFQAEEITRTGIASLKVGFNQVFGYYIEITHTHASKVPPTTSASRRSRTPSATSRRS